MRKHLKTLVSVLTAVITLFSLSMIVSAREVVKTGTVYEQNGAVSYIYVYYDDDRLVVYPQNNSTQSVVVNKNYLDPSIQSSITSKTVLVVDVSDICTSTYDYRNGCLRVNGANCPCNTIFITGSTWNNFYSCIFSDFNDIQQISFPGGTELEWMEIFDCGFTTMPAFKFADIYDITMSGCNNLKTVRVPEGVSTFSIEDSDSVTRAEIPDTLRFFQAYNCPALYDIDIPDSLRACHLYDVAVEDVIVPAGCYFTCNSESLETAYLPEGRTRINEDMFKNCTHLSGVNIPDGVTSIEYKAFACCFNLSYVELPSSVRCIESYAFLASGIRSINIPDGVTEIEYATFRSCGNLNCVQLPSSIHKIEETAFQNCDSLSDVFFDGSRTQFESILVWNGQESRTSGKTIYEIFGDAEIHFSDFIVEHPDDFEGPAGSTATFTVVPEGDPDDYMYQWQYFKSEDWIDITTVDSATSQTLELPVTEDNDGWLVRCIVRDITGKPCFSKSASITVTEPTIIIIDQTDVNYGMPGEFVEIFVEAEGEGLKYQWQVLKNGSWVNCSIKDGAKTPTLTLEVKASRDGSQYHCIISDKYGASITSEVATLYMTKLFVIETQPEDFSGYAGETATFFIEVEGEGVKYQWQQWKNGAWTNCSLNDGARTNTLSLLIKDSRDGSKYQCVVTNKYGETLTSDEVTLTVKKPLAITSQPTDFSGGIGETAKFIVEAQGEGLKYQWQVLKNGTWTNCSMNDGAKTDTLSLEIKESRDGSKYHCIVTDKTGATVTSDEVTLSISHEIYIVAEPEYCFGDYGDYATFVVEAEGDGLKYQWQVWKNGAWTNCSINDGAKTDSLTLLIKESRNGSKYHCIITDKYGNTATTTEVYLYALHIEVIEEADTTVVEAENTVVEAEETVEPVVVEEAEVVETVEEVAVDTVTEVS